MSGTSPPAEPGRTKREPLSRHPAGSLGELAAVAVPLMVSTGTYAVMIFCDRLFLARYSADAFAAALPSGLLIWTLMALSIGLVRYSTTFVSQYHGAGRPDRVKASIWQAMLFAAVSGAVLWAATPLWLRLIESFGHEAAVLREETAYFAALTWTFLPRLLTIAATGYFAGRGRTGVVMVSGVVGSVVNLVLDPLLIFGSDWIPRLPFGPLGVAGAAAATVVGTCAELAVFLIAAARETPSDPAATWRATFGFDGELFRRMVRFGLPQGMQFLADLASFQVVIALVGRLGKPELVATNLAFQLNSLAFVPMIGLGRAVSTIVGHRVGEANVGRANASVMKSLAFGMLWMGAFVVAYFAYPDAVLRLVGGSDSDVSPEAMGYAVVLLKFIAVYSLFDVAAIVFGAAVNGAGDTKFSFLLLMTVNWSLMVLPLTLLVWAGENTLYRSWGLITLAIAVLGVSYLLRYRYGPWRTMTVLGDDAVPLPDLPTPDSSVEESKTPEPALAT